MKATILLLVFVACAAALPKSKHAPYRTVFKNPDVEITSKRSPRIIGGHESISHSLPYQAYLEMNYGAKIWSCSGAIISSHYILTSGRCLDEARQVLVTVGVHDLNEYGFPAVTKPTIGIRIHPDYNYVPGNITNDIALLKMEFEIEFNDYVQPIALPSKDDVLDGETFVGHTARASGWGMTNGVGNNYPDVLNYFDAKVIKTSECDDVFFNLTSSIICTSGSANSGICTGDVGGPLVADYKVIGVSSWWAINCITGYPSGYTRVSSYIDWIVANSDVVLS